MCLENGTPKKPDPDHVKLGLTTEPGAHSNHIESLEKQRGGTAKSKTNSYCARRNTPILERTDNLKISCHRASLSPTTEEKHSRTDIRFGYHYSTTVKGGLPPLCGRRPLTTK